MQPWLGIRLDPRENRFIECPHHGIYPTMVFLDTDYLDVKYHHTLAIR